MPMDYNNNEFNIHNVDLAEEVSSTVSPVLRPYDYEDGGRLSFDSLVENEVFLGITGQEDNQWIEEYSRGASSSAAESRHNNVWSEATSSESVEMLLNSVGQEAFMTESSDGPGSLPTNVDPNLKQYDGTVHAQEAMVTNKEEGALTTEELDANVDPGSLVINMDPNLRQDDETNHGHEAMVTNKAAGPLVTEELDASDDLAKLTTNMDSSIKEYDGNNHSHEAIIRNKPRDHVSGSSLSFYHDKFYVTTTKESQEGTMETEELDVSKPGSFPVSMAPNSMQDDGTVHVQDVMVTNKVETLVTEELDASDEPGNLAIHMDPNLKQNDEIQHAHEAMTTNKEVEALATEELDASDEPDSLAVNMDSELKQDDETNHAQEVIVTNIEVWTLATEDVSDESGSLAVHLDSNLMQDEENNHAQDVIVTNIAAGSLGEFDASDEPGSVAINMDPNLKQDIEINHAQEAIVANKEVETLLAEELDVSDDPGMLTTNMRLNLKRDDEIQHAQEAMVTNKEVGEALVTEELDASDEAGSLAVNMNSKLKQDDETNHAQEMIVTNIEVRTLATEVFDVSDEPGNLASHMGPYLMQDEETNHAQDVIVTNIAVGPLATGEFDASDEPGSVAINTDPNLKHDGEINHAQEAMVTKKEVQDDEIQHAQEIMVTNKEVEALVTEESYASDDFGMLTTNMDPNLKQDDENKLAQDALVTNKALGTEELDASDDPGQLTINMDPHSKHDDESIHAQEAQIVNKPQDHFSEEAAKDSGGELDLDVLGKKNNSSEEKFDDVCDVVNHVARNIAVELYENKVLEELSTSKIERGSLNASTECNLKRCPSSNEAEFSTKNMDNPIDCTAVEACTNSDANPLDLDLLNKPQPPTEVDIPVDEESMPAGSCNLLTTCVEVSHDSKCALDASPAVDELNNDHMLEDVPPVVFVDESSNLMMPEARAEVSRDSKYSVTAFSELHEDVPPTAAEDDDGTESENLVSQESSDCSPSNVSDVQSPCVEESKNGDSVFVPSETVEESSIIYMGTNTVNTFSSAELVASTTDLAAASEAHSGNLNHLDQSPAAELSDQSPAAELSDQSQAAKLSGSVQQQVNDELQSSEKDVGMCTDHAVTSHVEGNAKLPLNIDSEALDIEKNLQAEGCKDQGSEAGITISAEQGNTEAKSLPVLEGTGSVHYDNAEKREEGFAIVETCENESLRVAGSMLDNAPLSVVEPGASIDGCGKAMHETSAVNINEQTQESKPSDLGGCSTLSIVDPIPGDSSVKVHDDVEAGGGMHESNSGHHVDMSREQLASTDDTHTRDEDDTSVSMDKLQSVTPLLNTDNTKLSQSTTVNPSDGVINENISLSEATEAIQRERQLVSSNDDMKADKSFTFEVSATVELGETGNGLQIYSASQACNLSKTMEVPCIDPNTSTSDTGKLNEAPVVTPQTPVSGTIRAGAKERKTRRKSSPLLISPSPAPTAAGHAIPFQDLRPTVEGSSTKPVLISNLPDLNNATCIFHQPFTNNQQVQLRAQILVYGSLISGMPPEEPHMIAAFGQSDAGRKTWEDAWHASLERVHGQKSEANTPAMQQSLSDLKDVSHRTPDLAIKHGSILSSSNKGTPPAVSPMIPISSPLWNMSTPSHVGFQSRNAAYQQPFTPLHPSIYQAPPNPLWFSPGSFLGQWGIASSPASVTPRLSALPRIEAVKLTPVKASGVGSQTYSMPVVLHSATDGKKPSSELKSRKRKKDTAAVSSVPSQVLTTPVAHPVPDTMSHNRRRFPFLVESQTDSVTPPAVATILSTSVAVSTPPSVHDTSNRVEKGSVQEADVRPANDSRSVKRTRITSSPAVNQTPVPVTALPAATYLPQVLGSEVSLLAKNQTMSVTTSSSGTSFPTAVATSAPESTHGYQKRENALAAEETLSKVNESKLQAENAALLAAAEVSNCQDVWSRLYRHTNSDVLSDAKAKLMSSASAAAAVAKMASAAAKMASIVTEQAKLLADEVFLSSKTENYDHISHPDVISKATPASSLKSVDKTTNNYPNSIISVAREAARRRIEAASAASKHAENLDAIVKAAELAAEAVSQAGKVFSNYDSSALKKLAEAGPEGFWKISPSAYGQHQGGEVSGLHVNSSNSGKKNVPNASVEEMTSKYGLPSPVHVAHNPMMLVIDDGSAADNEKGTESSKVPNLSKAVGVSTETSISGIWEEHNIKEGCLVEVYKEDDKYGGVWLAANVLSLMDEKALVCYTGIQASDEGSEKVKEWVAFEVRGSEEVPRIRIAHPMTVMRFEGARKRRRTAVTDYAWSKGDRVDVWMQDCWHEGVVVEPNNIDVTTLTVQYPVTQGETSVVRSWHVRPTLIWKDKKWIEWKGGHTSLGESPKEKRMKLGSPDDKLPTNAPLVTAQESVFNVGKSTNKLNTNSRTIQKDKAKVVFGVPKPGKKQKFMDVSAQYVDRHNRNNTKTGSFKFSKPPGSRVPNNDATENQGPETKPRLKPRKPPVPSFRTIHSRDPEPTNSDPVEKSSSSHNQTQGGPSYNNRRDQPKLPTPKKGFSFTSKPKSEHVNKVGRLQLTPKTEVKENSSSQANEPRRSNRKIQPTSRLLEGIQSSLTTISKIPSASHAGQRKVTSKGNTGHV